MRSLTVAVTLAAVLAVSTDASAQSTKRTLVPLRSYISGKDLTNDHGAAEYVAERCGGLYMAYVKVLENETKPEVVTVREQAYATSGKFLGLAAKLDMVGTTTTMEQAFKNASTKTAEIGNAYIDLMDEARTYSGDFSKEPTITGDSEICKSILPK